MLRVSTILALAALVVACRAERPSGELMLVLDGSVEVPRDVDWVHVEIRAGDRLVHSGDYELGDGHYGLPSTLGIVPGESGSRAAQVRVVGRRGGAAGRVRLLREARTQIPEGRVVALPMSLTVSCLDFVKDATSQDTESSCGAGRTCVGGGCAGIDINGDDLPDFTPGDTYDDYDGAVEVAAQKPLVTTERGGKATFAVRLLTQPRAEVRLSLVSSKPNEGIVAPAEMVFSSSNWATAQTAEITGVDDTVVDGDVAYAIVLGETSSDDARYRGLDPPDVDVTNRDDDGARIEVTPTSGLTTTEAGGQASFTVRLAAAPFADVTIPLASTAPAEGSLSAASLVFTPANWSAAQTVVVTGLPDALLDGDRTYAIELATPSSTDAAYASLNPPDVTVTNIDSAAAYSPLMASAATPGVVGAPGAVDMSQVELAGPSGEFVAFASNAANLVPGDTNEASDVFMYNRTSGGIERVSVATGGAEAHGASLDASVSHDGRFVVFQSAAADLVQGDTNGAVDVFLRDRVLGQTQRISVATGGTQGNGRCRDPSISADGRYVIYISSASNLVAGDTNSTDDLFLYDRVAATTTRVSVSSTGVQGNGSPRQWPRISDDGSLIVYASGASNLVPNDTNGVDDTFAYERATGTTRRVSVSTAGVEGDGVSVDCAVSGDGRFVAYRSNATNFVAGDTNNTSDVFLYDMTMGTTRRVSVSSAGAQGLAASGAPYLSRDGRYLAFDSQAPNLVAGDTNAAFDVFVTDTQTGVVTLMSKTAAGGPANGPSYRPKISSDGRYAIFISAATNLVAGDPGPEYDTFLVRLAP